MCWSRSSAPEAVRIQMPLCDEYGSGQKGLGGRRLKLGFNLQRAGGGLLQEPCRPIRLSSHCLPPTQPPSHCRASRRQERERKKSLPPLHPPTFSGCVTLATTCTTARPWIGRQDRKEGKDVSLPPKTTPHSSGSTVSPLVHMQLTSKQSVRQLHKLLWHLPCPSNPQLCVSAQ